jgi:hypothetical protein
VELPMATLGELWRESLWGWSQHGETGKRWRKGPKPWWLLRFEFKSIRR